RQRQPVNATPQSNEPGVRTQKISDAPPSAPGKTQSALLLLTADGREAKRIELSQEVTRLGRDPDGEVVIDAAAAVVSRRHAEIKKSDGQFFINDLKSFNGTLVNGQRITEDKALVAGDEIQRGVGGPVLRMFDAASQATAV